MNLIKRLFCKHDYTLERNIGGDEIIAAGYNRSICYCTKCGKRKLWGNLDGEGLVPEKEFTVEMTMTLPPEETTLFTKYEHVLRGKEERDRHIEEMKKAGWEVFSISNHVDDKYEVAYYLPPTASYLLGIDTSDEPDTSVAEAADILRHRAFIYNCSYETAWEQWMTPEQKSGKKLSDVLLAMMKEDKA